MVYLLVATVDLPKDHGFLVASTLLEDGSEFNLSVPQDGLLGMQTHPGALLVGVEQK